MEYCGNFKGKFKVDVNSESNWEDIEAEVEDFLNEKGFEFEEVVVYRDRDELSWEQVWIDPDEINDERKLGL